MTKLETVLLVDDCEATNYIHRIVIEGYGCAQSVVACANGQQALEFLCDGSRAYPQPELILLDINMPVMNGWEFLEAYQALPAEQQGGAVVVMLTTSGNPDDYQRAEQLPAVAGYTSKPLDAGKLEAILAQHYPFAVRCG